MLAASDSEPLLAKGHFFGVGGGGGEGAAGGLSGADGWNPPLRSGGGAGRGGGVGFLFIIFISLAE